MYMTILFLFGQEIFSSRPQYGMLGTGISRSNRFVQSSSSGAAPTPLALPYPFGTSMWTLMDAERGKREARRKMYFERYSSVCGEVDNVKLGRTLFPNWRHILSRDK